MSVYRVEKSELPFVVFQAGGSIMKGIVFLSAAANNHMGQQTLLDLLKESGDFFPFRSEAGEFCVTNKQTITYIRFEPPEQEEKYQSLGDRENVEIKFVGGEQLRGTLVIEMPKGRNRLFDFINNMEGFSLLQNEEAHYMVNVSQVLDISPKR